MGCIEFIIICVGVGIGVGQCERTVSGSVVHLHSCNVCLDRHRHILIKQNSLLVFHFKQTLSQYLSILNGFLPVFS